MKDTPKEDYHAEMPEAVKVILKDIGASLGGCMPAGWGFALLMFTYGEGGAMSWISSAQRADMCSALEEMLFKLRKEVPH